MARDPSLLYPHDRILAKTVLPLIPRVVTPNHVTIFRYGTIPFIIYFLFNENYLIGLPLFVFSACTDAIDGSLARTRKMITRWGTFYDPVADKLLIMSTILLLVFRFLPPWFAAVIVLLELLIGIGGYVYRKEGKMQSANVFGKWKMFAQSTGVTLILAAAAFGAPWLIPYAMVTLSVAIVLAVISLYTYGL